MLNIADNRLRSRLTLAGTTEASIGHRSPTVNRLSKERLSHMGPPIGEFKSGRYSKTWRAYGV
jgi:hypothetical protein